MEWFNTWFNTPYYHLLYQNRDYSEAETFLEKLIKVLNLNPPAKIIDLACGKGRHSIFLNKMGFEVLGLDLSDKSIAYDKNFENETLKFEIHDMRLPIKSDKVAAVFNLFTSFGYFQTEEEDQKVFDAVAKILHVNGIFVLDFMNAEYTKTNLIAQEEIERGNVNFHISREIKNERVIKHIDFRDQGKDYHFEEIVKLHNAETIAKFAQNVGLERIEMWGNYNLDHFDLQQSPRCINVFRKA